jgi:O-antigen ligase
VLSWGAVIFVGLWLVLRDINPVTKAKLMGQPLLIHTLVVGSGLWIHGGSADGAMAAIVSGICSAVYVRWQRQWYGYIRRNQWHPGALCTRDPRSAS